MFKNFRLFYLFFLFPSFAAAQENGYKEAADFFRQRKESMKKQNYDASKEAKTFASPVEEQKSLRELPEKKFIFSAGYENQPDKVEAYLLDIGIMFLKRKHLHQNVNLEWRRFREDLGQSVSFLYTLQLSSQTFLLGPEFAFGAGRSFELEKKERSYTSLKLGLVLSNRWTKRYHISLASYYRRDQFVRDVGHNESWGLLLRVGI